MRFTLVIPGVELVLYGVAPQSFSCLKSFLYTFCYHIFQLDGPCRKLNMELLCKYLHNSTVVPCTLLSRVVNVGHSPILSAFYKQKSTVHDIADNGIVDTIRFVMCQENFLKPYSDEDVLFFYCLY